KRALDERDVAAALGGMYERFGGAQGFVEALSSQYDASPPGSYRRTKMLDMILRLTEFNSIRQDAERAKRQVEYSVMTDEELEQERLSIINESIVGILAEQLQIAVTALEHFGYSVIPPDDVK